MAFLAIAPVVVNLLIVGFMFICVTLVLLVLIQRPQGGGLAGAFGAGSGGGGGAGQTAFGTKTGDALTMATIGVFVLYLLVAIGLIFAARPQNIGTGGQPAIVAPGSPVQEGAPDGVTVIDGDGESTVVDVIGDSVEGAAEDATEAVEDVIDDLTAPAETPTQTPAADPGSIEPESGDNR